MAVPHNFPQINAVWKGLPATEGDDEIADLPAYVDHVQGFTISCWKLSSKELQIVQQTGQIWLHIWGMQQPPIYIDGLNPFEVSNGQ